MLRTALAVLLCCACLPAADEVELRTRTGAVVRGELAGESADAVTIRQRTLGKGVVKTSEITVKTDDIAERKRVPAALDEYAQRSKGVKDDAPEQQNALAQWCMERALRDQAVAHATKALAIDASSPWSRRIMEVCGMLEIDGRWVVESDYFAANKLARFDGKVMPVAEADNRRALAKASGEREELSAKATTWTEFLKAAPKQLAECDQAAARAAKDAESGKAAEAKAREALTEWQKGQPGKTKAEQDARKKAKEALDKQIDDAEAKQRDAAKAEAEAKRKRTALARQQTQAEADLPPAKARLTELDAEILRLQTALGEAPAPKPDAKRPLR